MADGEFDPQKIEDFLNRIRQGQDSWKFGAFLVGGFLLLALLSSTIYTVSAEGGEVGVVQRFGKYVKTTQPGIHLKLPWGIDRVTKVKTKRVEKQEFGFATRSPGVRTQYARGKGGNDVTLMLTGDLNIADVEWSVQYRKEDPMKYLFNVRDPESTLRDAAEAAMRMIVGDRSVDEVLTVGREEINLQSELNLQEIMDSYETGIKIITVELQDVNPPEEVKESFDDVNKAKQQRETMINKARESYNKVIPQARGIAEKLITSAEGYAAKRINEAEGDASRFIEVYKAYAASPTVTKRKLYIEYMSEFFKELENVWIIDDRLKNMVPLLQMMKGAPVGDKS